MNNSMQFSPIVQQCYALSVENLLKNATGAGLAAANQENHESQKKNYTALFSRDIGVSTLGMILSENDALINLAKKSLATLVEAQNSRGQFPFYYKPQEKKIQWWTPGSIDSTLWWSIAFLTIYRSTGD